MSLRCQLRLHNSAQKRLERASHHHPGCTIIERQDDVRYLQLHVFNEYGQKVTAFFNIDKWLQNMDSHLPGIPWQQVPLSYLTRWLNTLQLSFWVEEIIWTVEHISLPAQVLPDKLLSLPAEPCDILCLDWPRLSPESSETGIYLSQIPLILRYVLGNSQIPLSALIDLEPGDLLIIRCQSQCLTIGQYKLFSFSYQGNDEVIVEQSIFDNQQSDRAEEECLLDWKNLPVDIEFVLDSNPITLEKLNDIDVGSTLLVSSNAEQRIKIYLNRKFFALGELVALEEGGLAVEINQINIYPEDKKSHADAE